MRLSLFLLLLQHPEIPRRAAAVLPCKGAGQKEGPGIPATVPAAQHPDLGALEQHGQLYLSQVPTGRLKSSTRAGQLAWLQEELTRWKKAEE